MSKEKVIVITKDELDDELDDEIRSIEEDEKRFVRIGAEDLVEESAIIITTEEIVEGDIRSLFQTPLRRQFIDFVSAGLPDVFLRSHEELLQTENHKKIQEAIDEVPDQALKKHLASRLEAVKLFRETHKEYA
ncbi:MAG: hypothetical protein GY774_13640 [Planctomycetes bacterium]|nr:hypothetical protein [Planctomycetota bacterium]